MFGMSRLIDAASLVNTTDSPIGFLPNAVSTQASVGAKSYLPLCGPEPSVMDALLPTALLAPGAGAAGMAGVAGGDCGSAGATPNSVISAVAVRVASDFI